MAHADRMSRAEREAYWRGVVAAGGASGCSVARHCREEGIPAAKYYWWRRELKRRDAPGSLPVLFAEVRPVPRVGAGAPPPIEIALAGERVVRVPLGFDAGTLAQVVRVLEGLEC